MHSRLGKTRGAAVAVACVDPAFTSFTFAGVGNITAFVAGTERRSTALSQPGIVGHNGGGKPRIQTLPLGADSVIVMHSDGLRDGVGLNSVPGLARRPAAVIAGTLLRDAGTRPDDASVLVARRPR
jgi:hypothetical protein